MATKKNNPAPNRGTQASKAADDGFEDVKLDTYQYKADKDAGPLQGYLFDFRRMPDSKRKDNPEWYAFYVSLTAPCTALDREGEEHDCVPGDIVTIAVPGKLRNHFGAMAIDRDHVTEIKLGEWSQVDIGGGKKMWSPAVCKTNPRTIKKRLGFLPSPIGPRVNPNLNGGGGAPQLPAGGESDAADAPF